MNLESTSTAAGTRRADADDRPVWSVRWHRYRGSVAWLVLVTVMLAACGGDGDENDDTLLTGFSGVVILALLIWFVLRKARNRR